MLTDTLRAPHVNKPMLTRRVRSHTWPRPHMVPAKSPLAPRSGTAQDPLMPPAKGRSQPSPEEPTRSLTDKQAGRGREGTHVGTRHGDPTACRREGDWKSCQRGKGF